MGGYDVIGQVIPQRVAADPIGVLRSYETGRVNTGGLGLASTPIIDFRTYTDFPGDIHTRFHSFVMRQRLEDANGTAANQVIFISNTAGAGAMAVEALTRMEQWLAAIHSDTASGTAAQKVIRNRPTDLSDACWTGPTTKINEIWLPAGRPVRDALPDLRRHADRGRWRPRGRHLEVPAEAAELRRLSGHVHGGAARAVAGRLPDRGLRLQ